MVAFQILRATHRPIIQSHLSRPRSLPQPQRAKVEQNLNLNSRIVCSEPIQRFRNRASAKEKSRSNWLASWTEVSRRDSMKPLWPRSTKSVRQSTRRYRQCLIHLTTPFAIFVRKTLTLHVVGIRGRYWWPGPSLPHLEPTSARPPA